MFLTNRIYSLWSLGKWPECCAANDSSSAVARSFERFRRKFIPTSGAFLQSGGVRTCYEIPLRILRLQLRHSDNTFTILTSVNICNREQRSLLFYPVIIATPWNCKWGVKSYIHEFISSALDWGDCSCGDIWLYNNAIKCRDFNIRHPHWYAHAKVYFTVVKGTVTTNTHTCGTWSGYRFQLKEP